MKKMYHLWKRIFSQYAFVVLLAFGLVFATIYFTMSSAMRHERRVTMDQQLEICSSGLDTRVEEVLNLHTQFLNDVTFRRYMRSYNYNGMRDSLKKNLAQLLGTVKDSSWLVNTIYVIDQDFQVISSTRTILNGDQNARMIRSLAQDLAKTQAFRAFHIIDGKLYFLGALYLDDSYDYVTYIGMELSHDRFFFNFTATALQSFQSVLVVNGAEVICRAGDDLAIAPEELADSQYVMHDGRSYAVFACRNRSYANWKIYALMDESTFNQAMWQQIGMVVVVLLLSLLATLITSFVFTKRITRPLEQLTDSFHRLEQGEYPPPLEVDSNDEIGQLIHSYNHVVQSLEKLNENILAEQEEKRRFELAAMKTRLDLLQSQIQPHFIHNTLNTLNFMAIDAGNMDLSALITSFNALLRMSISTESDFCTVESEITCIKHYLRIQRSRYADRALECNYTVDEQAKEALLPRLVLQPLVENALYHGILPLEDRLGVIQVQCTKVGDRLCVSVSDNGSGIPDETLRRIKEGRVLSSSGYNHIGIHNVKERLQLMYHQECEFKIISHTGSGTTIFFSVPFRR